jgi:hypothetical protein
MNDFQMRALATDRQRELLSEADRSRLARLARTRSASPRPPTGARQRRPRLADLVLRVIAPGASRS